MAVIVPPKSPNEPIDPILAAKIWEEGRKELFQRETGVTLYIGIHGKMIPLAEINMDGLKSIMSESLASILQE